MRVGHLAVASITWFGAGMVLGGNVSDLMQSPVYATLLGVLLIATSIVLAILFGVFLSKPDKQS